VVAATNKNLSEEIKENRFREDLYHRLSVILIHVPTLNERLEDIPLLADHFIRQICNEYGMPEKTITDDAIKELQQIHWRGNIREFRNVIERLIILVNKEITGADVKAFAAPLKK
ncbi:MAG: sigma 54-interacting transcriptional regulator, partial [Prolixibacteraceae bacterium]